MHYKIDIIDSYRFSTHLTAIGELATAWRDRINTLAVSRVVRSVGLESAQRDRGDVT
jgi:hypothetical protein